jgi:hypothetical protein
MLVMVFLCSFLEEDLKGWQWDDRLGFNSWQAQGIFEHPKWQWASPN